MLNLANGYSGYSTPALTQWFSKSPSFLALDEKDAQHHALAFLLELMKRPFTLTTASGTMGGSGSEHELEFVSDDDPAIILRTFFGIGMVPLVVSVWGGGGGGAFGIDEERLLTPPTPPTPPPPNDVGSFFATPRIAATSPILYQIFPFLFDVRKKVSVGGECAEPFPIIKYT
mmetsp:Transcript_14530/g.21145  ORF Transcript_14530/g.21145 Transcript_14530/m.21145 type:complete len:173 (-) Transcript_14530:16-534(-)